MSFSPYNRPTQENQDIITYLTFTAFDPFNTFQSLLYSHIIFHHLYSLEITKHHIHIWMKSVRHHPSSITFAFHYTNSTTFDGYDEVHWELIWQVYSKHGVYWVCAECEMLLTLSEVARWSNWTHGLCDFVVTKINVTEVVVLTIYWITNCNLWQKQD